MSESTIVIDTRNWKSMIEAMDIFGESEVPFCGKNADGENVMVSIFPDCIVQETFQNNGWIRVNTYWRDYTEEETYKK